MTDTPQTPSGASASHAEDEIDLGRLFGLLLDHKWLIIVITFAFSLAGVVYAMLATPIYQGDALVQVERRSSISPLGDLGDVFGTESEASTSAEVQILQSRMVLGQVVDRVELDTVVQPRTMPVVGDFVLRRQIPRPAFMQGQAYIWGGESIQVGRFEVRSEE